MTPDEALQTTLAAEHAAIHVLATLGGTVRGLADDPGTDTSPNTSSGTSAGTASDIAARHDVHGGRREQLRVLLRNVGVDPVAALPAYELPPRDTVDDVRRGVLEVEQACLTTYAALVASSTGEARAWAVEAHLESARAVLAWGAGPTPFPGAEDLLDL